MTSHHETGREQLPQGDQLYSPCEEQSGLRLPMPEQVHKRLPRVVAHTASQPQVRYLDLGAYFTS